MIPHSFPMTRIDMATAEVPDPEGEDAGLAAQALDHEAVGHGRGQGEAGTRRSEPHPKGMVSPGAAGPDLPIGTSLQDHWRCGRS